MPATFEPIATTTLGSTTQTITFSSISSSYTDLRLILVAKATGAGNLFLRFNSDTGTNYSQTIIFGTGSAISSQRQSNATSVFVNWAGQGITTTPHLYQFDIFSYAGSTNKSCLIATSEDENSTGYVGNNVGLWRNTSAINTVTLSTQSISFDVGTTATLYGILKA